MSSLIRRIERQMHPSRAVHPQVIETKAGEIIRYVSNEPRHVFFMGRGSKLGFRNPKAKDLLARQRREARNAERRAAKT